MNAHHEEKLLMLTNWRHKGHTAKLQPCAVTYGVCLQVDLTMAPINIFGDELGQKRTQSIDSRQIRH
jgi:hypothetical protein